MSAFKDYLHAGILTGLFEKVFLTGRFSKVVAIMIFASLGAFWIGRKVFGGIYFILSAPWNTKEDKTYRLLKKIANEVLASGKSINSMQKNMDWMNGKWHALSFYNSNGRNQIREVSFLVHPKFGYIRIFIYSEIGETLELLWKDLHRFTGIQEDCDLRIENLSEIYRKMYLNLL